MEGTPASLIQARRRDWVCAALIFAATMAAYFPALGAGFIWNDNDYVTRPELRSLWGLGRIWWDIGSTEQYYPLLHSAFWLEHRLWGDSPLGYHLINAVLHALSACLVGFLLRRWNVRGAWFAAAVFALHPVCVESVAWISEEKNTLSTLFYLTAALLYWKAREEGSLRRGWYWAASGLFLCALLSKSVTASLPAALLLIIWWREGSLSWRKDVAPLVPWLVVGAAVGVFTGWVEKRYIGAEGAPFALTFVERLFVASRGTLFYLGKLIWPANLIFIYPRWDPSAWSAAWFIYPIGVAALGFLFWSVRRRNRAVLAGFLFFIGTLFPTLGFFNIYAFIFSFVADHWQYLACLGVLVPLACGLSLLIGRFPAAVSTALKVGILCFLGILVFRQSRMYRDMETFYRTTLAKNPACWMAHNNLGALLEGENRLEEAVGHYRESLRLFPNYAEGHFNLGTALYHLGRLPEARQSLVDGLRLKPNSRDGLYDLGLDDMAMGRLDVAADEFRAVLRIDPGYAEAQFQLGRALASGTHLEEALAALESSIRLKPGLAEAHEELGNVERALGRGADSLREQETALRLEPANPDFFASVGRDLGEVGRSADAILAYREALRLKPDLPIAEENLGVLYANQGQMNEALGHFAKAVALNPSYVKAQSDLGQALHALGREAEAQVHLQEAARLGRAAASKKQGR